LGTGPFLKHFLETTVVLEELVSRLESEEHIAGLS
jgi:hypothetical protein